MEAKLNDIRSKANFAAHYGQKFDREMVKLMKNPRLDIRIWITREEALEALSDTVVVLGKLASRGQPA